MDDGKRDEWDDAMTRPLRSAVRRTRGREALMIANAFLENELTMTVPAVCCGHSKGWRARKRGVDV